MLTTSLRATESQSSKSNSHHDLDKKKACAEAGQAIPAGCRAKAKHLDLQYLAPGEAVCVEMKTVGWLCQDLTSISRQQRLFRIRKIDYVDCSAQHQR